MGTNSPSETYPCKGGGPNDYCYIYTSRANPQHWERLLKIMGREDLIGDPRFDSPQERFKNRHVVDEMIAEWTIHHDKMEVMQRLGEQGIPAGAIMDTMELSNDPDLNRREIFVTVKHPVRGDFKMPGWPVKMSGSKVPITAAPLLGADTDAVYGSCSASQQGRARRPARREGHLNRAPSVPPLRSRGRKSGGIGGTGPGMTTTVGGGTRTAPRTPPRWEPAESYPDPAVQHARSALRRDQAAVQRGRRASRDRVSLGRGSGVVRRRPLPPVERHPQQPHHAVGRGDRRGQRLSQALQPRQRQYPRPPGPARHLRARGAAGHPHRI